MPSGMVGAKPKNAGYSQPVTASSVAPGTPACRAAHRRACFDSSDPSTPTTMRAWPPLDSLISVLSCSARRSCRAQTTVTPWRISSRIVSRLTASAGSAGVGRRTGWRPVSSGCLCEPRPGWPGRGGQRSPARDLSLRRCAHGTRRRSPPPQTARHARPHRGGLRSGRCRRAVAISWPTLRARPWCTARERPARCARRSAT